MGILREHNKEVFVQGWEGKAATRGWKEMSTNVHSCHVIVSTAW